MPETEYDTEIAAVKSEGEAAGVKTFVVGLRGTANPLGASYDPLFKLSQWAVAGGTSEPAGCVPTSGVPVGNALSPRGTYCHLDLTTQADFPTAFVEAMDTIRVRARSCTLAVPPPPAPWPYGSEWITLTYSSESVAPRVLSRASDNLCTDGQWYVRATDLDGFPQAIELCPNVCSVYVVDPGAVIEVMLTCPATP
jgi:hypothetical protein